MFVYSLAGLTIEGQDSQEAVELPDNATTSRLGVYQAMARLLTRPDADSHAAAVAGEWPARLAADAKLLPFTFDFGIGSIPPATSAEEFHAEYLRLFDDGTVKNSSGAPLYGGAYGSGDRAQKLEEVVRFYDYFGLHASPEDQRPADHLCTELEFMKYLTFKEAVTKSARLQPSFRRAQHDFLDRQIGLWLPQLVQKIGAVEPLAFWKWAVATVSAFASADAAYLQSDVA